MGLQDILWGPAEGPTQQLVPSSHPQPQGEKLLEGRAGEVLQKTSCCGRLGVGQASEMGTWHQQVTGRARRAGRDQGATEPRHRGLKGPGKPSQEDVAWRTQEQRHHSLRCSGWLSEPNSPCHSH